MQNSNSPEWRIATGSIVKLVAAAAFVYVAFKLYPLIILLALSLLVAVTLYPAIGNFEKKMPHWLAALLVTLVVILSLVGLVAEVIPALIDQFAQIAKKLPEMQATVLKNIPNGMAQKFVKKLVDNPVISSDHVMTAGQVVVGTVSGLVLMVALALYLAADGQRAYLWLRAFFSPDHRKKIDETCDEMSSLIVAYVVGQLITSVLCAIFVLVVLQVLHVPGALVLSVLAAVFDVLPLLGFFLFTIPAVLFALTVSPSTAFIVACLYLGYHLLENYVLVPKVYGNRLRLSDLVVLLSVLAGTYLAGIPGAVLILPLVAAYPAFERIWLVEYVGREAVKKHKGVETAPPK